MMPLFLTTILQKLNSERKDLMQEKIHVIHNSIYVPLQQRVSKSGNEIRIISVCRFVKSKDFNTALYSFKELAEKNRSKELKYYIVGYGPMEKKIRSLADRLGLDKKVVILINPSGIPDILRSCNIYLSTSLIEGLSNSIMEAMVAGLPVVATDVGDSRYLVNDGYNGFIVRCGDIKMIVEKLDWLVNNETGRIDSGANSYSIIRKEFSDYKLLENYLKLISEFNFPEVKRKLRTIL